MQRGGNLVFFPDPPSLLHPSMPLRGQMLSSIWIKKECTLYKALG